MASNVSLGGREGTAEKLVKSGRYGSKSELPREGVRLVEEREKRLSALDAAIAMGLAEMESGKGDALGTAAADLVPRYEAMAIARGE